MANEELGALIDAAHQLSRAAPAQWKAYEAAFGFYTHKILEDVVSAPPEQALIAHGKGQALLILRNLFRDIERQMAALNKNRPR